MKNINKYLLILAISLLSVSNIWAQKIYKAGKGSEVIVKGTSTVHDWKMTASAFDCSVSVTEGASEMKSIVKSNFVLKVQNLKSDNKGLNDKAYDALKTNEIKFHSTSFNNVTSDKGKLAGTVSGILTVAGVSKNVTFDFDGTAVDDNKLTIDSKYRVNMKDFGVEPPKAMMGMIKSGKDVDILIRMNLISE